MAYFECENKEKENFQQTEPKQVLREECLRKLAAKLITTY